MEIPAFQRNAIVLFRSRGGLDENSCCSASEVKPVAAGLAQRRRLGIFSAAVVGCARGSWLSSL